MKAQKVLVLVNGPLDGERMAFFLDQTVVPTTADGPVYRYSVAADGRAYFQPVVSSPTTTTNERTER